MQPAHSASTCMRYDDALKRWTTLGCDPVRDIALLFENPPFERSYTPRMIFLRTCFLAILSFALPADRKSTRLNSSHRCISYAVFCLKKKNKKNNYYIDTIQKIHADHVA